VNGDRRFLPDITKDKIRNVGQKSRTNPFSFPPRYCRGAFHMRPKTSHRQNGRIWNPPLRSGVERANLPLVYERNTPL